MGRQLECEWARDDDEHDENSSENRKVGIKSKKNVVKWVVIPPVTRSRIPRKLSVQIAGLPCRAGR